MSDLSINPNALASQLRGARASGAREYRARPCTGVRLRANPEYELVSIEQLARPGVQRVTDLAGVLRSRTGGGLLKGLRPEMAQLYLVLQAPGGLPEPVRTELGEDCDRVIAALVLDRVLEIEHEGQFVCGASAYDLVCETVSGYEPTGAVARLSLEALQMAQALAVEAPSWLASRLYHYNRMPATPSWMRRLTNPEAVAVFLGIALPGKAGQLLERMWHTVPASPSNPGWLSWRLRTRSDRLHAGTRMYKLYISPECEFLPEAFDAAVGIFTQEHVPAFKVGSDVYGLLRPDKLVAYFWDRDELLETAARLQERLTNCPAQGVPFTAGIDVDGLLSWGIDPPDDEVALGGRQESWRSWLARRIATSLLEARRGARDTVQPWQFALGRLALDGIDTNTWTPTGQLWN